MIEGSAEVSSTVVFLTDARSDLEARSSEQLATPKEAAIKGAKSDNVHTTSGEVEKTIKEDELSIKVSTKPDVVTKTYKKEELFIDKEELKGMRESFDLKVRELLQINSVDVTHQDELDNTLLHYAVIGNSLDLLSKFPKTLTTKGNFGLTPLHIAALLDYSDVARELMDMNDDIELKDKYDKTPLLVAAEYGSSKVIEILLGKNACINQTDNQRRSVLHLATNATKNNKQNNTDGLELILTKSRELETEAGDQEWKSRLLHMKTAEGKTALHHAVFDNRKDIVTILLPKDLDINDR
ncbi:transient receptor potential cation channel subfamily A member 1-like [Mercenaria mercenaria]|uniref:transient receptor potential cation channel subfamily A member 1-like n=1 Tax=Mercenaria mercenaria TaxID=6596 RepID=UPI00234FAEE0|nr:transient receptor potential cation channel subfamily A member 1-like [Mercenaria mercenaria]